MQAGRQAISLNSGLDDRESFVRKLIFVLKKADFRNELVAESYVTYWIQLVKSL